MYTNSTHGHEAHSRFFVNAWIVTISLFIGISVLLAAVLVGWPVFYHLVAGMTG